MSSEHSWNHNIVPIDINSLTACLITVDEVCKSQSFSLSMRPWTTYRALTPSLLIRLLLITTLTDHLERLPFLLCPVERPPLTLSCWKVRKSLWRSLGKTWPLIPFGTFSVRTSVIKTLGGMCGYWVRTAPVCVIALISNSGRHHCAGALHDFDLT